MLTIGDLCVMKKIFSALFSVFLFLIIVPTIHAQQITPASSTQTPMSLPSPTVVQPPSAKAAFPLETDSDVPQNFHTYSQNVFIEILTSISCILTGYDPLTSTGKCLGINPITHKIGYVDGGQGGAIGIVGNMIGMTFNIPVSSGTYMKDMAAHFGITKTGLAATKIDVGGNSADNDGTFAAGYGYTGLKPVIGLWRLFRNIVYILLVLVFIVIGVGIMLRVNVDARSVMSIQNQLPKIIIGIILITFSYAIAGLIVDLMYVSMYLVYYLFYSYTQQGTGIEMGGLNPSHLQGANPLSAVGGIGGVGGIAEGVAGPFGDLISSMLDNRFGSILAAIVGGLVGGAAGSIIPFIGTAIGAGLGAVAGGLVGGKLLGLVGGLLAYIIIFIAVFWALMRLWFLLLRSYIFFLIDVVLAPFWIGLGLLPKGGTAGFSSWFRDIVANLAVFPATLFILLLAKVFTANFAQSNDGQAFVPPLIGNLNDISSFSSIIGLGILLLLPGVVTMVRETLKAPGFKYTQQIAQSLGQGQKVGGMLFGKTKEALWHTNPKDGSPERLKKWYLDKFRSNWQGRVVPKATSPIAAVGRNIPILGIGNRMKKRRLRNVRDSAISRASDMGIHGEDKDNLRFRAGGFNPTTNRFEGSIGGHKAWENENGTVTIDTGVGQDTLKPGEVFWDRKSAGGIAPSPVSGPEVAAETSAETAAGEAGTALHPSVEGVINEGTEGFSETQLQQLRQLMGEELNKPENKFGNPEAPSESELENVRRIKNNAMSALRTTRVEGGPVAEAPSEEETS